MPAILFLLRKVLFVENWRARRLSCKMLLEIARVPEMVTAFWAVDPSARHVLIKDRKYYLMYYGRNNVYSECTSK